MSALAELERRLQDTSALIVRYEHALSNPENSGSKGSLTTGIKSLHKLRSRLESEFLELAAIEEYEVFRYRIIESTDPPSLLGIAEAWMQFQKLFATIYRKLAKTEMPSALGYSYCFSGSVGVVVTLPKLPAATGFLSGNPIDDTSTIVFDLIESKRIAEIARELGPEPISAVNDWLSVHVRHGYGLGLEWNSDRITKRRTLIASSDLPSLQTTITETRTNVTLTLDAELFAVNAEEKTFKLRPDGDQEIDGTFTDAITAEHAASVPSRYRATVVKTIKMGKPKNEKEKSITYFLERLDPL